MKTLTVGVSPFGIVDVSIWKNITDKVLPDYEVKYIKSYNQRAMPELDYLIFDGGSDVTPFYYGQVKNYKTGNDPQRDAYEYFLLRYYLQQKTMIFGICRGHQFINAVLGGTLYQDLYDVQMGHPFLHKVWANVNSHILKYTNDEDHFTVNSTHHQAVHEVGPFVHTTLSDSEYNIVEGTENGIKIRTLQCHPEMQESLDFNQSRNLLRYLFRADELDLYFKIKDSK
jgi:gamma-glutamyl-gamma-aminobutyrate hydrolase PuuD